MPEVLTIEPAASVVVVDTAEGSAVTSVVVRNIDSVPRRCTLRIMAVPAEIGLWFSADEPTRELMPAAAATFLVQVKPLDDRVGEFPFFALVYDANQPDEASARSDVLKLVVKQAEGGGDAPDIPWSISGERGYVEVVLSTGEVPTFTFTATAQPGSVGYVEAVLLAQPAQDVELGTFGPPEPVGSLTVDEPKRRFGTGAERFAVHVVASVPDYWPCRLTIQATLFDGTGFPTPSVKARSDLVEVDVYDSVIIED